MTILPLLIVGELLFLPLLAWNARSNGYITSTQLLATLLPVAGLAVWTVMTGILALRGVYESPGFYQFYPALWLPVIPIALVLVSLTVPNVRLGITASLEATPAHWLAFFQAGRIAAIGTAYHTIQGQFPLYFEVAVGLPDLLFGLSALVVGVLAARQHFGPRELMAWHLVGCLIIVPTAPILLQLGLPGPLQVFTQPPTAEAVYAFPMSLAPTLAVPIFVLFNLLAMWREWRRLSAPAFKEFRGENRTMMTGTA